MAARAASIVSPVSVSSSATGSGIRRLRKTPPPAGNRARFTSGTPNFASAEATMRSHASSSSNPPATAVALAAPMTGLAAPSRVKRR